MNVFLHLWLIFYVKTYFISSLLWPLAAFWIISFLRAQLQFQPRLLLHTMANSNTGVILTEVWGRQRFPRRSGRANCRSWDIRFKFHIHFFLVACCKDWFHCIWMSLFMDVLCHLSEICHWWLTETRQKSLDMMLTDYSGIDICHNKEQHMEEFPALLMFMAPSIQKDCALIFAHKSIKQWGKHLLTLREASWCGSHEYWYIPLRQTLLLSY